MSIYKVYSEEDETKVYYGSTKTRLCNRLSQHKYDYQKYLNKERTYITSFEIIKLGKVKIELVEECFLSKLKEREAYYIKNFACVNKRIPGRTKKEYYLDNEEKMKAYYKQWTKDNRDKINKKYHENKDVLNSKRRIRESTEDFKKKKSEQDKKYVEKNKERLKLRYKEKIQCPSCDKKMTRTSLNRHKKKFHM